MCVNFHGGDTVFCQGTGTSGGTFSSGTGLVIDASTGEINLAASTPGNYQVTYTPPTSWQQMGQDIDGLSNGDKSGWSICMNESANRIAIGSPFSNVNGSESGHVLVYEWNGINWVQLGSLISGSSGDRCGWSVTLSSDGNRVAVGSDLSGSNGYHSGQVRVFEFSSGAWNQLGSDINGENSNNRFGYSVSLNSSGDKLAIGAIENNGNGNSSGHVRIFNWDGSSWNQLGQDIDGENSNDESGTSVALNSAGTRVIIGAPYNSGNGTVSGHARVYELNLNTWTQIGQDIDGESGGDLSGKSVSINGTGSIIAIGAVDNDGNGSASGHVRIFEFDGSVWNQLGQDLDGELQSDYFGCSVSLNTLGDKIVIGGYGNDGNGTASGHSRVFSWDGVRWNQVGGDIDGEFSGDNSGRAVSINGEGRTISISSTENGSNAGHVRLFSILNICPKPLNITILPRV